MIKYKAKIEAVDAVHIRVLTHPEIRHRLSEKFSFLVDGYQFMPAFKERGWDGKKRLYNMGTGLIYRGLLYAVIDLLEQWQVDYTVEEDAEFGADFPDKYLDKYISQMTVPPDKPLREFQIIGFKHAIRNHRAVYLSATGSGKSMLMYMLARYVPVPTLLIVPSIGLVSQMYSDFKEYDPTWEIDYETQLVHGKIKGWKKTNKRLVITTWQSIDKQPEEWFARFDQVLVDEVHEATAGRLTSILEKLKQCHLRYGFSGTIQDAKVKKVALEGMFGPVKVLSTTRENIDKGISANIKVKALVLKYHEEDRARCPFTYPEEVDFLAQNKDRNNFLVSLIESLRGNTLVLFTKVEKHGKPLYELLRRELPIDRPMYYIDGTVDVDLREAIRHTVNKENNSVLLASYGTTSRGININRIHNIVFASAYKSKVKVLQSLGRGTRLATDKDECVIYDIVDDLTTTRRRNFAFDHFKDRVRFYINEQLDYKQSDITLR